MDKRKLEGKCLRKYLKFSLKIFERSEIERTKERNPGEFFEKRMKTEGGRKAESTKLKLISLKM